MKILSSVHARGWAEIAVLALVIALVLWPALAPWQATLGSPLGETDNHQWMYWVSVRRALGDARVLVNAPAGGIPPLMDPINFPLVLALWPLGPALAYNGLALGCAALAAWGGWRLGDEVAGPAGRLPGAVAMVGAPFFAGVVDFGITESWPMGWFALHVAFLLAHARTGRARDAVWAGGCLGAIALSGWYHALFGLLIEAMLVPWLLWRSRRPGLVWQGMIGLVLALPALWVFLPARGLWAGRWHLPPDRAPPPALDWVEIHRYGTDLLNLITPRLQTVAPSKAVYLGWVVLALAVVAVARRAREALPWVVVSGLFLLLALGPWPRVGGAALGVPGPAWVLVRLAPDLAGLSHWHRAVGAAVPFLAALAALGASALPRRAGLALAGAIALDGLVGGQTPWPRPAIAPDTPAALLSLPRGGPEGVVQIPFDNSRVEFSDAPARLYNRWQTQHGRPVSESYESRDELLFRSALVAAADGAAGGTPRVPPEQRPPAAARAAAIPTRPEVVCTEIRALQGWGYGWLILHLDRARTPELAQLALERALGAGERRGEEVMVWDLRDRCPVTP